MDDVGGGSAKVRSESHGRQRTDSSRRAAGSAGGSIRAVGHRRKSPGITAGQSGDSKSAQGKEISANCRRTSRVAFKIKDIEQVVIMSKHCALNGTSPVLLSPRCARPLAQLFGALIREDDACT